MAKPRPEEVLQYSSPPSTTALPATTAPDPYLELELYLEKVNEEIGAVFDRWQQGESGDGCYPDVVQDGGGSEGQQKVTPVTPDPPAPPQQGVKRTTRPLLPDLLPALQQQPHDLVTSSGTTKDLTATSPLLQPKEVENFLRKVESTILGDDKSVALDAGTQTQDLSRSSSVTWLSSSSLLDSPASGPSAASTREESSSTEDTSSSSEALLQPPSSGTETSTARRLIREDDEWLRLRTCSGDNRSGPHSDHPEPVWQLQSRASLSPEPQNTTSRDGAASDNEMASQRKRKHQQNARDPEGAAGTSSQQTSSPSLNSLSSLRATVKPVGTPLAPELSTKSSSAPVLAKQHPHISTTVNHDSEDKARNFVTVRSHSERQLSEIEAVEACRWMRAAGFPQYAQMYEDLQFPVDLNCVQKDHPFLDRDALQALFRRLHVLNKCAKLRVDGVGTLAKNPVDDSDEEVECALSENWTFLHQSRRWSRVTPLTDKLQECSIQESAGAGAESSSEASCAEGGGGQEQDVENEDCSMTSDVHPLSRQYSSLPPGRFRTSTTSESEFNSPQTFRRTGSEKIRDGAKAFLRRVESLKTRGKRQHKSPTKSADSSLIGKPQVIDVAGMQERMRSMNCVDVVVSSEDHHATTLLHDAINSSPSKNRDAAGDDTGTQSDTEHWTTQHDHFNNNNNQKPGTILSNSEPRRKNIRKRSQQQLGSQLHKAATLALDVPRHGDRPSVRHGTSDGGGLADLSPDLEDGSLMFLGDRMARNALQNESALGGSADTSTQDEESSGTRQKTSVLRWHSFGRGSDMRRPSIRRATIAPEKGSKSVSMMSLSCGQLMVLKQLAMLQLTAVLEKHCPALRSTGFNWELPKFMKKCKSPHKDQQMFGVSLLSSLQQTGHALPPAIQAAMQHLTDHALDHVGLFRKPGVRSRIQKLRIQLINTGLSQPLELSLEEQQSYDVADVVKQFFRELPEALLTSKLSDTFLAIFQYVPASSRHEAVRWALLLLPDQHREVLQFLICFLRLVASHSKINQMTASNLAVCLAPSLFHSSQLLSPGDVSSLSECQRSASPRSRTKRRSKSASAGSPDAKELTESRAAHDCLLYLINNIDDLVTVSEELLVQCHFSSMEQSIPLPLGELGADLGQDWKGYMQACTSALLKECRERQRGWVTINSPDTQVELSYKKVGDGHPLRIWRVSTEVEAPPAELLRRILREQYLWDPTLVKWRILSRPEQHSEVYHYVCSSMKPLPPRDYCVLRSWRSDLAKGGCVLVETSIDYPGSNEMIPGTVQAIVLASRYLIEPCGSGRSRVLHLSRVDTKGRSVEWYNKCYGHACALNLTRMRASFLHTADGPESKV